MMRDQLHNLNIPLGDGEVWDFHAMKARLALLKGAHESIASQAWGLVQRH
jgi:hypothetical protein